jgi:dihydrofolate reductase
MRKIVAGLFVSANGVVEAPDTWTGPYFTPEIGQLIESMMDDADTLLLGRVTYQGFADAFGGQDGGMAGRMNGFPKVVVSTTLDRAKWQNSTLIGGNVAEEIIKLKQRPGRNINMSGSGTLVTWLLREGLLDQLDLLQFPVVVGRGKRLFEGEGGQAGLTLAASQTFGTGVVHLTYQRAGG